MLPIQAVSLAAKGEWVTHLANRPAHPAPNDELGPGLIDQIQKMTAAAMQMAEK